MLRRSFGGKDLEVSSAKLRKNFWGTSGRYTLEGVLLGFVEEMGHEYKHLLEGAIEEDEAVVDTTAIAAANIHIIETLKTDDEQNWDSHLHSHTDDDDNEEQAAL